MTRTFRIWILLGLLLSACSSADKKPENAYQTGEGRPLVDDKYSLQADRKQMEELRAQIPEDKKKQNDELAFILSMMAEVKRPPSEIRSQFDSALRKKREIFDKDMRKERENFTKEERKKRETFLKSQQDQRQVFNREKHSRQEKDEFYKGLDEKRSEFFSVERDRRNDFESDARERRKNFDDYARQKQNEFNQEHRAYSKRFEEWKKETSQQNKNSNFSSSSSFPSTPGMSAEAMELEREMQELKLKAGTPLESGE